MQTSNKRISVLIATYNEEQNIERAIQAVEEALPKSEIIIVDDGSKDKTVEQANNFKDGSVKIISLPHRGKGATIKEAVNRAGGDILVQIDADLQFPAEGLPQLIRPLIKDEADIVFGSRYLNQELIEKGSIGLIKRLSSLILAKIISFNCRQRFTDVFAGFKAFKREVIKSIDIREKGFTYEAEIAIKAKRRGFKIVEVPTRYMQREYGKSKIKFFYHSGEVLCRVIYLIFFTK
jgi:glycosyltransferase involved in cell wall biosynthesis